MLGRLWEMLLGYLKEKPYWARIQPLVIFLFAFVAVESLAFMWIQSQYGFRPPASLDIVGSSGTRALFLRSYVFKNIALVFAAVGLTSIIFTLQQGRSAPGVSSRWRQYLRDNRRLLFVRAAVVTVVLALLVTGLRYLSPNRVSHIRVVFMDEPTDFDPETFAYLVYELNRLQRSWYFDIDFDVFNPAWLKTGPQQACGLDPERILCYSENYAEELSGGSGTDRSEPVSMIGITGESLGRSYFAVHRGKVSVISTFDRQAFHPLSTYRYLMYCLILQSLVIHLDANCRGLPDRAFRPDSRSHGGVFQFNPRKELIKASILAASLSPPEEQILFNCFGGEYTNVSSNLLSLEWLRSKDVAENLEKVFGVRERNP